MDSPIQFSFHEIEASRFPLDQASVVAWLEDQLKKAQRAVQDLGFILSHDDFILDLNKNYLKHDYYTDILTFPYDYSPINAEIYISLDRVKENAEKQQAEFKIEVLRVIAHGVLHMLGYDDHKEEDIIAIRQAEDRWIDAYITEYE